MNFVFYLFVVFLILVISFFRTPTGKGVLGELIVNIAIKLLLDKKRYFLLKDVILPASEGTTQIDHIIVSAYGIFVVETKNMKGWIFGGEKEATWTQKIYKYTNKFQNPLRQNYKHIKTLETLLRVDSSKLFSLITFVGDSTFKTPMPENVTQGIGFIKYIKSKYRIVLSPEDCKTAITLIEEKRLDSNHKTRQNHVDYLNKKYGRKRAAPRKSIILVRVGISALIAMAAASFFINFQSHFVENVKVALRETTSFEKSSVSVEVPTNSGMGENAVVYRWVDEFGKTHYSNVGVPEGYRATELKPKGYKFE